GAASALLEYRRPVDLGDPVDLATWRGGLAFVVDGDTRDVARLEAGVAVGFDQPRLAELAASPAPRAPSYRRVALPLLAFALVALTAALLARHEPRSKGYFRLFFSDPIHMKAGFATAAALLACFQIFSAAWIFKKLPWSRPAWIG